MNKLRVINITENCRPNDLEGSDILIVTGITVSTLRDAVRLSQSAREQGIVTVGIPLHDVSDMGEFRKYFDAVIISQSSTESIAEVIPAFVNQSVLVGIVDVKEILRNAGTVYFVEGSALARRLKC